MAIFMFFLPILLFLPFGLLLLRCIIWPEHDKRQSEIPREPSELMFGVLLAMAIGWLTVGCDRFL
jgi:hypothetical protein